MSEPKAADWAIIPTRAGGHAYFLRSEVIGVMMHAGGMGNHAVIIRGGLSVGTPCDGDALLAALHMPSPPGVPPSGQRPAPGKGLVIG